jgi:hypothetical protein
MSNVLEIGVAGHSDCPTDPLADQGHNVTGFDQLLYEERFLKTVLSAFINDVTRVATRYKYP